MCQDIRVNALVGTRSPYSLPFVILPVPARSPFRFIRHWRRSTPNPGRGAFLLLTKSCPRVRGQWHEVPKGVRLKTAECRELFPLSFAYAQQLPRFTVEPLGAVQTRRTVPYPFAERSFQWGYGGRQGA